MSLLFPAVEFSADYPERVRRLYQRIVNHTINQYRLQFRRAPPGLLKDPFLSPITAKAMREIPQPSKEWLGDLAGLADEKGFMVELDNAPNIWTVNRDAKLIGHELGHVYATRAVSGFPYTDGQIGRINYGQVGVNYVHLAVGLHEFRKDDRYFKTTRLWFPPRYGGGIVTVKLMIIDIVGMFRNRAEVDAEIMRITADVDEKRKWRLSRPA